MLLHLTNSALAALGERDGRTEREVVTVIVESVLASLREPSREVEYAGAVAIHSVTGVVISYERARDVLRAFMDAAGRN